VSKTGTLDDRKKIIAEHLPYEVNMLRLSHYILLGGIPQPLLSPGVANLAIEGFCTHARNLIDFFADQSPARGKDAVARHFTNGSYSPFNGKDVKKEGLYGRINKQIMHLTYDRTDDPNLKIGPNDREQLRHLIENEIIEFQKYLREPYDVIWREATGQMAGAS
jgi:hypothetical protein